MKNSLKIMLVALLAFALSGCYKVEIKSEINKDKSMNINVIYAIDKKAISDMASSMGGTTSEDDESSIKKEDYAEAEKEGYTVEDYSEITDEKDYEGVKMSKKFDNIDDLLTDSNDRVNLLDSNATVLATSGMFKKTGNVYKSNFNIDLSDDSTSGIDLSSYTKDLVLTYTVTLPKAVKSSNATTVSNDKKTLTWNLEYGKVNQIDYEFEISSSNTTLYIILGVVAVATVAGVVVVMANKKKQN